MLLRKNYYSERENKLNYFFNSVIRMENKTSHLSDSALLNIRINIPGFQPNPTSRLDEVPANLNFRWLELFRTLNLELDPTEHFISGPAGVKINLFHMVGEYVNYFPQKQDKYFVTVESNRTSLPGAQTSFPDSFITSSNRKNSDGHKEINQYLTSPTESKDPCSSSSVRNTAMVRDPPKQKPRQRKLGLSEKEKEMPDMAPLDIRHRLPELQHLNMHNLLAGVLLTWVEFFGLLDKGFELDPRIYVLKGSNGARIDVNEQIGTYINSFKRKQKTYNVTLIRVASSNEQNEKVSNTIPNQSYLRNKGETTSTSAAAGGRDGAPTLRTSQKKMKLLKTEEQRGRNTTQMERLAQDIIQSQLIDQDNHLRPPLPNRRMETGRGSVGSRSDSFACADPRISNSNDGAEQSAIASNPNLPLDSRRASSRFSVDSRRESRETPSTSTTGTRKRGRKPKQKPDSIPRNSRSTRETESSVDSSESEDDESPSKAQKKLLKQCVLAYLRQKVSPRSFLRIRSELTELREKEKYFKVTSILPMTAGMLEQAFCRKTND